MAKIVDSNNDKKREQLENKRLKRFHGGKNSNPIKDKRISSKGRVRKTNC